MGDLACSEIVNHPIVMVEENKIKAKFRNKDRLDFRKSKVDACLVTEGQRCDYVVSKVNEVSILVELKGVGVEHACDQLFASVSHQNVKPHLERAIGFLVVCSKYPRFDTFVAKAKVRALKEFRAGFHVVVGEGEFDIERVAAINGPK